MEPAARAFQAYLTELSGARDTAAAVAALQRIIERLGLGQGLAAWVGWTPSGERQILTTYPDSWREHYVGQGYAQCDPVLLESARTTLPYLWGAPGGFPSLTRVQRTLMAEAREAGIRSGLAIPVHQTGRRPSSLHIASDLSPRDFAALVGEHTHLLHLLALYFHTTLQALTPAPRIGAIKPLSPQEEACLLWAARGKSHDAIATILKIARSTVGFHLANAQRKLLAGSLAQAIAKAAALGLIDIDC